MPSKSRIAAPRPQCQTCMNWEIPDPYMQPKKRNGFCIAYKKETRASDGDGCLAHKIWPGDAEPHNAELSHGGDKNI